MANLQLEVSLNSPISEWHSIRRCVEVSTLGPNVNAQAFSIRPGELGTGTFCVQEQPEL